MSAAPMGSPIAGSTMIVGHGVWLNCAAVVPTPVAMMRAMKQMIDNPIADATMKASTRSVRCEVMGVSFATYTRIRVRRSPLVLGINQH